MGSVKGQSSGSWAVVEYVAATHEPVISDVELVCYMISVIYGYLLG